jgi:hypothetical protein
MILRTFQRSLQELALRFQMIEVIAQRLKTGSKFGDGWDVPMFSPGTGLSHFMTWKMHVFELISW